MQMGTETTTISKFKANPDRYVLVCEAVDLGLYGVNFSQQPKMSRFSTIEAWENRVKDLEWWAWNDLVCQGIGNGQIDPGWYRPRLEERNDEPA
jgi:hypothetical protein